MSRLERRRRPRISLSQCVVVRQDGRTLQANLVDLSESGVCFETSGRVHDGDDVQLRFRFPWSDDALILDAAFVRSEKTGTLTRVAAKFNTINANTKLMLTLGVSKVLNRQKAEEAALHAPPPTKTRRSRKPLPREKSSLSRVLNRLGL